MAYTNGNLALQPKRKPDQQQQPVKETKRVVRVKGGASPSERLRYLLSVAFVVGLFVFIIFRYAQDYRMELQIRQMDASYKDAVIDMKVMQGELAQLSNPDRIRAKAQELGMIEPSDGDQAGKASVSKSGR